MPKNREMEFPESLIGQIVQFYYSTSTGWPLTVLFKVVSVSLFTSIKSQNIIIGDFITGEAIIGYLFKHRITSYKILTVKELPLFLGYPHKSPLFDQLLRGD